MLIVYHSLKYFTTLVKHVNIETMQSI